MIIAGGPLASVPLAALVESFSEASKFDRFLQNIREERKIYLVEMFPAVRDTSGPTIDTKYFSIGTNTPDYDGNLWLQRLMQEPEIDKQIFRNEIIGGVNRPNFAPIDLANGDGEIDDLRDLEWYRRKVNVYLGGDDFDFADFQVVICGLVESLRWNSERISFTMADCLSELDTPFQETLYAGTGGDEGGEDIEGTPKPRALGSPRNVTPVLVERAENVYQFNDRESNAVTAVYDRGVQLTAANSGANDVSDLGLGDVRDWHPVAGQFITDLSKGLIRTGAEPDGQLTADVEGDLDGTIFLQTTADIIRWIAAGASDAPLNDPADIDESSFADVNLRQSGNISLYVVDSNVTVEALAQSLIAAAGGYIAVTSDGKLRADIVRFKTASKSIPFEDVIEIERTDPPRAFWRRRLGHAKSWTVQGQEDIDEAAATEAHKDFVRHEFRFVTAEDTDIEEELLESRSGEVETFFDDSSVASTEATRQVNLLGARRDFYSLRIFGWSWRLELGETITLTHPDMRDPDGQSVIIGRVAERENGVTELLVWG